MNYWRLLKRGSLVCVLALMSLLGLSPFYIYDKFNADSPIASLSFQQVDTQHYIVELSTGDFCRQHYYAVFGDQWRLDASFLKWRGAAVMLGLESRYRLDRLEGRYISIEQQNVKSNLAHDLRPDTLIDLFDDEGLGGNALLVDTVFGSSVYLNINTDLDYIVYKTEDGLITRSMQRAVIAQQSERLTIEINRACHNKESFFSRVSTALSDFLIDTFK